MDPISQACWTGGFDPMDDSVFELDDPRLTYFTRATSNYAAATGRMQQRWQNILSAQSVSAHRVYAIPRWSPSVHAEFPSAFRAASATVLALARGQHARATGHPFARAPLARLPHELLLLLISIAADDDNTRIQI